MCEPRLLSLHISRPNTSERLEQPTPTRAEAKYKRSPFCPHLEAKSSESQQHLQHKKVHLDHQQLIHTLSDVNRTESRLFLIVGNRFILK